MGTTLSVVNDTDSTWNCRLGPDEAAVQSFAGVTTAVGAAVTVVATAGSAAPLASALAANGVTSVMAAASVTSAAVGATTAAKAIGLAVSISASWTAAANEELRKKGYVAINPGDRYDWNDLPAALWQQCHCTRTWYDAVNRQVVTEYIFMRPIFSANLVGETAFHNIQWWKDKDGHYTVDRQDV